MWGRVGRFPELSILLKNSLEEVFITVLFYLI